MSGAPAGVGAPSPEASDAIGKTAARLLDGFDKILLVGAALAALAGALVLTESVIVRYFLKKSTEWQDETAVFLLVGATFLSAPHVQAIRGHVGIEALREILSPGADRWRRVIVDIVAFLFCAFFAWKSWDLFREAWVDGQTTASSWGPPLWIPYVMMSAGMTLLSLRMIVQAWLGVSGDAAR